MYYITLTHQFQPSVERTSQYRPCVDEAPYFSWVITSDEKNVMQISYHITVKNMDEFIKLLDPAYELIQYRIKEDKVIFHIASTITELECPFCGRKTSKVHSIYEREIQDLPMQGKKVILLVDTRKMRCMNPDCSHKTFSEKHPFVTAKSKKTNRLIQNILYTSSQLSSLNASKLLKSENITVCKSSICDLLKKNAIHCG